VHHGFWKNSVKIFLKDKVLLNAQVVK